jgi:serine protease DegQ
MKIMAAAGKYQGVKLMGMRSLFLIVSLGVILVGEPAITPDANMPVRSGSHQLEAAELEKLARSIVVKVRSHQGFLGSGILIRRQGKIYTVVTNDHVLIAGDPPYQIETPDGKIYPAQQIQETKKVQPTERVNDLGLLQFRSLANYTIATLGSASTLAVGESVLAAGFPLMNQGENPAPNLRGFVSNRGEISWVLDKALEGGYRIGYTNGIQKGMSGGPLLNARGEVVAINGMHAEPLWGNPYIYQDGSTPSLSLREKMSQYSWGIPVEKVVQLTTVNQ